jgi:tRNA-modifying protein YgfZ
MQTITPNLHQTSHRSVIRASGADAASFLQGQLSNDFVLLPTNQWQLAAYCSPKGRMLASFWGIKLEAAPEHQDILLVLSSDIAAATLKRLSMFVMRAKVKLTDASEMLPELYAQHGLSAWSEREVARGVARITAPLVDVFVPQMLNYESIGGVSFKKGCYPGQEIVARSQFRGAIKRRTYLVEVLQANTAATLPVIGEEIFAAGLDESIGLVVQIDSLPTGETQALVCLQTSSAEAALTTATGRALKLMALPYVLRDDI